MAQLATRGILYSGDIFAQAYNTTTDLPTGAIIGPLPISSLVIEQGTEAKTRKTKTNSAYGTAAGQVMIRNPTKITMGLSGTNRDYNLLVFGGDAETSTVAQTGATIVSQEITVVLDAWHALVDGSGNRVYNISDVSIDGTPDVDITGVNVNGPLGLVFIGSGLGISAGANTINFTYATVTGSRVAAGIHAKQVYKLWGDLINQETLAHERLIVPKWNATTNSSADWLGDDYGNFEVSGECIKLPAETGEYYLDEITES